MEQINPNVLSHSNTSSNYDISSDRSDPSLKYTGVKQKERITQERAGFSPGIRRPFAWMTDFTRAPTPTPRSCSADDSTAGADSPDSLSRQSIIKMSDATETKKANTEPVRKLGKRRMKASSSSEDKGEGKGEEKNEAKSDLKVEAKKTVSRNAVRRSSNSAGGLGNSVHPVIRVKVSPSGTTQSAAIKLVGDTGKSCAPDRQVSADGSSNLQEASPKRRPPRRKAKKSEDNGNPRTEAPVHPGILRTGSTTTSLTAPTRTSPLHCAFLNALKECSPRLIAALSATNEAAFLNAMWSCFWRGYRAGFQASVRELEASSGVNMASHARVVAAAAAALEVAPRGHVEKRRGAVKESAEIGGSKA